MRSRNTKKKLKHFRLELGQMDVRDAKNMDHGSNQTVFFNHFLSCIDSTLKQEYAGICRASY